MRAVAIGLTVLLSIGAVSVTHASEPGTPRGYAATGENSNRRSGEIAATAQGPPRSIYSCQSTFVIPFTADVTGNTQEVLLFVSMDHGRTWGLYERQPAAQGRFVFRAANDGDYWFASRTTATGMPAPAGASFKPELSVIVDTTDPRLDLQATVEPGGEIKIVWESYDQHLAPETLKLEYQSGLTSPWRPISIQVANNEANRTAVRGETSWQPDKSDRIVSIRAVVQDKAENSGEMTRRLIIPLTFATRDRGHGQNTMTASSVPPDPFAQYGLASDAAQTYPAQFDRNGEVREKENDALRQNDNEYRTPARHSQAESVAWPTDNKQDANSQWQNDYSPSKSTARQEYQTQADRNDTEREKDNATLQENDNEYRNPTRYPQADSVAWPTGNKRDASSQWQDDYPPSESPAGPRVARRATAGRDNTSMETPSVGSDIGRESSDTETGGLFGLPQGERPHMTRSRRFNLDYSIDAVGPLGVEKVELWVTRNGGRDWDLWGVDEDRESPFLVSVENEGIYGFRIVIVGRNGLASETPRAGDLADLWVGVDTTKPVADITSAAYGSESFAGHLDVRWTVTDDHLGARPITLAISEKRSGPWTPIASGLPNTGQYHWRVDSRVPDRFYLRLEVRDEAGNITTRELDSPIKSAGLTPKGHVRGIEPTDR